MITVHFLCNNLFDISLHQQIEGDCVSLFRGAGTEQALGELIAAYRGPDLVARSFAWAVPLTLHSSPVRFGD